MATKILVVEDEEAIRGFIKVNLKRNKFDCLLYTSDAADE